MTSDQLYNQYKGTSIPSFDGNPANNGQCEQWYLMNRTKRDGYGVISGNAIDRWYVQETDKYIYIPFKTGVYPLKDDYVVWGVGVGSLAGHVDVCAQNGTATGFLGYDSNWADVPILKTIIHTYAFGILGYVRRKDNSMQPTPKQAGDVYRFMTNSEISQKDLDFYITAPRTIYDMIYALGPDTQKKVAAYSATTHSVMVDGKEYVPKV